MKRRIAGHLVCAFVMWAFLGVQPVHASAALRAGGSGAALGLSRALAQGFAAQGLGQLNVMPRSLGSSGGIRAVLAGALDVAVSSRPLTASEQREGARATLIGRSPVVFVTSRADAAPEISRNVVVKMFGLQQLQWPDGKPVYVVLRPLHEPMLAVLSERLAGMREALQRGWAAPGRPHAYTAQDNLEMAAKLPDSLAAASLTQLVTERSHLVRLRLDAVTPTLENLRTGAYPLAMSFYLVTTSHPSPLAESFVEFVQSAKGQSIMADAGVVPYTE